MYGMHASKYIFFFKSSQIYLKDAECAESKKNYVSEFSDFNFSSYGHIMVIFNSGQIYLKDAECAESKEKLYIRFFPIFIFRVTVILWSFLYSKL